MQTTSQPEPLTEIAERVDRACHIAQEKFGLPLLPTPRQAQLLGHRARRFTQPILYGGGKGGGKDMPLYEIIKTPFGEKRMGDMRVGDQVLNPDGTTARVIAVRPQGVQPVYRLTFADGSHCDAGAGHLWYGWEAGKTYKAKRRFLDEDQQWSSPIRGRLYTTLQVQKITGRAKTRATRASTGQTYGWFSVPVCAPQTYTRTSRAPRSLLDPYVLGVLIGDGQLGKEAVRLTCADAEIAQQCEARLGRALTVARECNGCITYRLPASTGAGAALKQLGLLTCRSWEKFVPEEYQYRPIEERWDVLRGLMDTDGFASKEGKVYFTTTSSQLARDVKRLVESLGGLATISEHVKSFRHRGEKRNGRLAYTLYLKLADPAQAFTLARKRSRCARPQTLARRVVDVQFLGDMETQCITVDNPNGLYLTRNNIVTHNSAGTCLNAIKWGHLVPDNRILVCRGTYSDLRTSTLAELMRQLTLLPHWRIWPGKHEAHNMQNGAQIWWTGVGSETRRGDGTEGHKLGSTEFGAIALEEAPDIPRAVFTELQQRLRLPAAAAADALQIWLTANPYPGWVKEDFVTNPRPGYHVIRALLRDNPHLYAGYEADMRQTLSPQEAQAFIEGDWEALSPADQAIGQDLLSRALTRDEKPSWSDVVWGMDVSRRGEDWTTLWQRAGLVFERIDAWQGLRITETADRVAYHYRRARVKPRRINIDAGGLGAGLIDVLVRSVSDGVLGDVVIGEVNGASAASDPVHFLNRNAELTGKLEAILRSERGTIRPDPERKVLGDLSILRYSWVGGRRKVQSNDQIRPMLGRSPDDGDGLLYTLDEGDGRGQDYVPDWQHPGLEGGVPGVALTDLGDDARQALLQDHEREAKRDRMVRNFFSGLGVPGGIEQVVGEDPWEQPDDIGYSSPVERYRRSRE